MISEIRILDKRKVIKYLYFKIIVDKKVQKRRREKGKETGKKKKKETITVNFSSVVHSVIILSI